MQMLIHADVRRTSRRPCAELLDNVKGILFMSTPHRGSHYASIGSICANMLEAVSFGTSANTALVHELRCGSKTLQEISNAFAFLGADMRIYTFIENCRMEWLTDVVSLNPQTESILASTVLTLINRSSRRIRQDSMFATRTYFTLTGTTGQCVDFAAKPRTTRTLSE